MKDLQRLVKIIDAYSPTATPLLNLQDESILETKLFNLLKEEAVLSDEEVARQIYKDDKSASSSFRMLKSRFKKKLYNHLHFLKVPEAQYHTISNAVYACATQFAEVKALIMFSDFKAALKLLEQVHVITIEYELTTQEVLVLENITALYADLNEEAEYNQYLHLLEQAYRKQEQERKAQLLFNKVMFLFKKNTAQRSKHLQTSLSVLQQLEGLWQESASSSIFSLLHKLQIFYFEQLGQYDKIASAVQEADLLLSEGKINRHWYRTKYYGFVLVYALLQCRQYEEGLRLAKEKEEGIARESHNWFAFRENYILLALHSKKYALVADLLAEAFRNHHFRKILLESQERYELLRRFHALVAAPNRAEQPELLKPIVQEFKLLPKDKSGFNLALLVLDVLEKLSCGELDDLEPQAERVRKYTQKYLKGEKAERPRLFLRLLLLALTKQGAALVREQGQKLLERLKGTPLPGDAFAEVEIVPYEHLWELVLKVLEQRQQMQ
ncbi:hypothetical protein [Pontibacter litorisediminis]|uniref:hypothetical protein n=1 Tax=Pontibacter litorisediminis TaxID=1846260 RepID=UPI0023ED4F06|nr:hypothetical protein [Pontibacter litorisediminis]